MSPLLFAIYLCGVVGDVEAQAELCMTTSFTDYWECSVTADLVEQLYEQLARARIKVLE